MFIIFNKLKINQNYLKTFRVITKTKKILNLIKSWKQVKKIFKIITKARKVFQKVKKKLKY